MKKNLISLISLLLLVLRLPAQSDSLFLRLQMLPEDQQTTVLQEIAFQFLFTSPDSSIHYAKKSLSLARNFGQDSLEAEAHMILGFSWFVRGYNTEALEAYSTASELHFQRHDSLRSLAALSNMAATYSRMGRLESALATTVSVLEGLQKADNQEQYGLVLGNAAMLYRQLRRYTEAKTCIRKAREVLRIHGSTRAVANTFNMLGMVLADQDSLDQAKHAYLEAEKLYDQEADPLNRSSLYHNLSTVLIRQGRIDSALHYSELGYDISISIDHAAKKLFNASSLAELHARKGDMVSSEAWLRTAGVLVDSVSELEPLSNYFRVLSTLQAARGQLAESYQSSRISSLYRDSILDLEKERALAEMEVKYQTVKKEQELAEAQILLERQQKEHERLFLVGIGLLGVIGVAVLMYGYRKRLEKQQILLREQIGRKEIQLETTIRTQEEERSRLARDLHDGIGQVLSAIRLTFGSFEEKISTERYQQALSMLDDACKELREVAHDMMPRSLEQEGLQAALSELTHRSMNNDQISAFFDCVGEQIHLPRSVEGNVYRIAQELVQNIFKHSGASEMYLQLIYRPESLLLLVEDNGKGIESDELDTGFGMKNIQIRAQAIHAHFHLENGPQSGTIATLRVPISKGVGINPEMRSILQLQWQIR